MKKIVIAIDGYSACGKSSTAKMVAAKMGYAYIDTGAMYRAVTLYFKEHYVNISNEKEVEKALTEINITFHHNDRNNQNETYLNGLNVESEIRKMYISENVSEVSALPQVRHAMVSQQQRMGKKRGVVMDGRDIGTRVFPDAELKVFMEADMMMRASRRQQELLEKKQLVNLEDIVQNLQHRDNLDTSRKESPLVRAEDAYLLDSSYITLEEQVEIVIGLAFSKILKIESERAAQ
jgi:cytidylate kinase